MKIALVSTLSLFCVVPFASAQGVGPGHHFLANWDLDGDGQVTLAEATEKRGQIFAAFDSDTDGVLSDEEYALFDEMRATDQADAMREMAEAGMGMGNGPGPGNGTGTGNGQGNGNGNGNGKGKGIGNGMGPDFAMMEGGMLRQFNDVNGDGKVSRDEFIARVPDWFAMMDRTSDGVVTTDDFGRN